MVNIELSERELNMISLALYQRIEKLRNDNEPVASEYEALHESMDVRFARAVANSGTKKQTHK